MLHATGTPTERVLVIPTHFYLIPCTPEETLTRRKHCAVIISTANGAKAQTGLSRLPFLVYALLLVVAVAVAVVAVAVVVVGGGGGGGGEVEVEVLVLVLVVVVVIVVVVLSI